MKSNNYKGESYIIQEKIKYTTRVLNPLTRMMSAFVYAVFTDENNQLFKGEVKNAENRNFSISFAKEAPSQLFVKYAVSYISFAKHSIFR